MMKKSTTFFEAKFMNYTGLLENVSFLAGAIGSYSPEFDVVVKGVAKHIEFINELEMKLLVYNTRCPSC
jgi:hypothetical protein